MRWQTTDYIMYGFTKILLSCIAFSFVLIVVPIVVPISEQSKLKVDSSAKISLYEGYLVKQDGKLLWSPRSPMWTNDQFEHLQTPSNVTSIINDPWPFTSGGPNCILKVSP